MTRPLLQLPRPPGHQPPGDAPPEWLVTNGLGGYAFGCVDGVPRRRFHGLLVAALPAPDGRTMFLHALDERVVADGRALPLHGGRDGGEPGLPASFALVAGLPVWTFALPDGRRVERTLVMPHDDNTVHVRYRLFGDGSRIRLELRPWLDVRPHEGALAPHQTRRYTVAALGDGRVEAGAEGAAAPLRFAAVGDGASFTHQPIDRHDVPYPVERDRGYDWHGSAHSPGIAALWLEGGRPAYFTATCETWAHVEALPPEAAWEAELHRRDRLLANSDPALQELETFLLPLAADQFLMRPASRVDDEVRAHAAGAESRSVIAGYPWFTDWGRDTMIALEGLALVTGRAAEARDILRSFALHVQDGLIPNLFPEGGRHGLYHTVDATLWFFHAVDRYDRVTGDHSLVDELLPALQDIVAHHQRGTRFGIHVDGDGLLTQGSPDLPLTWMDARMDGWVVTPRRGKPVEVNALWHNALWLLHGWLARAARGVVAEDLAHEARRCAAAFNARFWNDRGGCLYDVVDGESGDDDALRPNQLLAVAVRHPPLDPARWAAVVEIVARELLTPLGLRTLSRHHPEYRRQYAGPLRDRDGAYHQGTVWPWLIGPFADAWIKVHPGDAAGVRALLTPLLEHLLGGGCLGSVSEIFDPEPPYRERGCVAQAWSVAELARLLVLCRQLDEAADS
jgi:predicted glycogen debranching enzyme